MWAAPSTPSSTSSTPASGTRRGLSSFSCLCLMMGLLCPATLSFCSARALRLLLLLLLGRAARSSANVVTWQLLDSNASVSRPMHHHHHWLTGCFTQQYLLSTSGSGPLSHLPVTPSAGPHALHVQVLYDIGVVSTVEPFQRLVSQGMILGEVEYSLHRDASGAVVDEGTPGATASRYAFFHGFVFSHGVILPG